MHASSTASTPRLSFKVTKLVILSGTLTLVALLVAKSYTEIELSLPHVIIFLRSGESWIWLICLRWTLDLILTKDLGHETFRFYFKMHWFSTVPNFLFWNKGCCDDSSDFVSLNSGSTVTVPSESVLFVSAIDKSIDLLTGLSNCWVDDYF
jgi:hypothetical protein